MSTHGYENKDWYQPLKKLVTETSQTQAGKKLGVNPSYINALLNDKKFPGRLDRVESKLRGALLNQTVQCPVAGEITSDLCQEHQSRPWSNANAMRVRLYNACRNGCPQSKIGDRHE